MKRLVSLLVLANCFSANGQSFPVKNVNQDYIVSHLSGKDFTEQPLLKITRDRKGLYWFQCVSNFFSFDGVNWRSYPLAATIGKNIPVKINDLEMAEDGSIWLATSEGIYLYDQSAEIFRPIRDVYPDIKRVPLAVSCLFGEIPGHLVFTSELEEGFFVVELKTKKIHHYLIDSTRYAKVLKGGDVVKITTDKNGDIWGLTSENMGVWKFEFQNKKILCSWKNELPLFQHPRFRYAESLTYSAKEKSIWISYGKQGYLEKINLYNGKSIFYSFSGNLVVHNDSVSRNRYEIFHVKIDRDKNEWAKIGDKYLVKLSDDFSNLEYLVHDPVILPLGQWRWFRAEKERALSTPEEKDILLWVDGNERMSLIRKRSNLVQHVPFDNSAAGIADQDYLNLDGHQTIFFEKGKDNNFFILQQDPGRPKLLMLDAGLKVKKALFNDEWKNYAAFFRPEFNPDSMYIGLMPPGTEPIDYRNRILKEFRVDMRRFEKKEVKLDFKKRIQYYGMPDKNNTFWLFSNGTLYSYDPLSHHLDSIWICAPTEKGDYRLDLVKGFDYPTTLHAESSTFWINFIPTREIYKVNLSSRKIERVFKCCTNRNDCDIPGAVMDIYRFDANSIVLQLTYYSILWDTRKDSLVDFFPNFSNTPSMEAQVGTCLYKDWICTVMASRIYLYNRVTGQKREIKLNKDFKWRISQFNSLPLINDRNELIVMSSRNKGFMIMDLNNVPGPTAPANVQFSYIRIDNRDLIMDSLRKRKSLELKYDRYNSVQIGFSSFSVLDQDKTNLEYTLYKGGDTVWQKIVGKPEITLSELGAGEYNLLIRASNGYGIYSPEITSLPIIIQPPFTQTAWFWLLIIVAMGLVFFGLYRYRMSQLKRLQRIRNTIASDLHDDIGSTLNSISIYSEVAKQQAGQNIPALEMIGTNSRKIIESMSDIVWTINPENDSFEKIIVRMRSFAYQLLKAKGIEFTFESDEKLGVISLPMQVRKNFYLVFKEAITNLVKYSGATRVRISVLEKNKSIVLHIEDNGSGIPDNSETQGNGLINMKRRAQEINAAMQIHSENGLGTSIELTMKT